MGHEHCVTPAVQKEGSEQVVQMSALDHTLLFGRVLFAEVRQCLILTGYLNPDCVLRNSLSLMT